MVLKKKISAAPKSINSTFNLKIKWLKSKKLSKRPSINSNKRLEVEVELNKTILKSKMT